MRKYEFVSVLRHPIEHRIWHWVFFGTMGILVLTGAEMYYGFSVFGGFSLARSWHIVFGFLAAIWGYPVYLYFLWATGDIKELKPDYGDITFLEQVSKNLIGLSPTYPEHSTYDVKARSYYRKYNPSQKLQLGVGAVALLIQGVTGLAMLWPETLSFWISAIGGTANVRALHLGLMYVILAIVVTHVYMAVIPPNREALKSMFIGKASERVRETR